MMGLLIACFIISFALAIAFAEDEKLEDWARRREIGRMADACRRGWPERIRQRSRYTVAGLQKK